MSEEQYNKVKAKDLEDNIKSIYEEIEETKDTLFLLIDEFKTLTENQHTWGAVTMYDLQDSDEAEQARLDAYSFDTNDD